MEQTTDERVQDIESRLDLNKQRDGIHSMFIGQYVQDVEFLLGQLKQRERVNQMIGTMSGAYTNVQIRPYFTVDGVIWTCEIMEDDGKWDSVAIAEEKNTMEEAVTDAYRQFLEYVKAR